eukprot:CAMPEP_0173103638 /NCGR_PEP_ID=MMETSP1102-20130122/38524_1 /TAXON_ID=49646 /ORGANISM="Geminigera sp., Strain Caron Lab Isolate" /LENGTH=101 /DNA_ID=CAMNT_0013998521 /DNA_START=249 /DNA_END=551 /DNA_ORIENTATION=-
MKMDSGESKFVSGRILVLTERSWGEQVREHIREQPNTSMIVEEVWHEQVREQVREQLNAGRSWREEVREQIRGPVRERLDDRAAARVQSLDTERPPSTDDE